MDDINYKLNIINAKNQQVLNMTSTDKKDQKENTLYNNMLIAEDNAKSAPFKAEQAKQLYYDFIGKDNSDSDNLEFTNQLYQYHYQLLESAKQSIQYYDSQYTYLNQINKLLYSLYKQLLSQLNQTKQHLAEYPTNIRKIYYIQGEITTLDNWYELIYVILVFLLINAIMSYQLKSMKYIIALILFMLSPFFYNFWVWVMNSIYYITHLKPFMYV